MTSCRYSGTGTLAEDLGTAVVQVVGVPSRASGSDRRAQHRGAPLHPAPDVITIWLPLQHLRDADNRLQHTRLQPNEDWPISISPELEPDFPILLGCIGPLVATETPAGFGAFQAATRNKKGLTAHWMTDIEAWSPSRWMHARALEVYYEDEEPDDEDDEPKSPLAVVIAEENDELSLIHI